MRNTEDVSRGDEVSTVMVEATIVNDRQWKMKKKNIIKTAWTEPDKGKVIPNITFNPL